MKVALLVADPEVVKRIQRLISFMCGDEVQVTNLDQAELLISDRPKPLLDFLDRGKLAFQVLYDQVHEPLPENKKNGYSKALSVFAFKGTPHLHSYPDMRNMVAQISGLALKEVKTPGDGPPYR